MRRKKASFSNGPPHPSSCDSRIHRRRGVCLRLRILPPLATPPQCCFPFAFPSEPSTVACRPHCPTARLCRCDPFDVLVISSGGALGLYAAVDAAQRGLRVAVVDAEDFGAGLSPPLLPGGFPFAQRALRQRDMRWLSRAVDAWRAMAVWANVAPRFVEDSVPTLVPSLHALERIELIVAAALASLLNPFGGPWRPFRAVTDAALCGAGEEGINNNCGGVVVRDAVLDGSAAAVALARTAEALTAVVLNYATVTAIAKKEEKEEKEKEEQHGNREKKGASACFALTITDTSTKNSSPVVVRARSVLNCTEAQTAEVRSMMAMSNAIPQSPDNMNAAWEQRQSFMVIPRAAVRGGGRERFGERSALIATSTLFSFSAVMILPWFDDCVLIGPSVGVATRDTLPSIEERAAQRDRICEALHAAGVMAERGRVLSYVSTVVPVLRPPADAPWASEILMNGYHILAEPGAVHVFGGTLALARDMAEEAVNKLLQNTGVFTETEQRALQPCRTRQLALVGAEGKAPNEDNVSPMERIRRFVRETYAVRLVDVVARRTHVAYSSPAEALAALPVIADVMGKELNWDLKQKIMEVENARSFIQSIIVL